jgi:hypothetical protein
VIFVEKHGASHPRAIVDPPSDPGSVFSSCVLLIHLLSNAVKVLAQSTMKAIICALVLAASSAFMLPGIPSTRTPALLRAMREAKETHKQPYEPLFKDDESECG